MGFTIGKRNPSSNKENYGRVCIVGGSNGMRRSVYLASMAALRYENGLACAIVSEVISKIMQVKSVEDIILPLECEDKKLSDNSISRILEYISNKNRIAIGYGVGEDKLDYKLMRSVLKNFYKPVLISADGLNSMKDFNELELESYSAAIVPHPLEFNRFSGLDVEYIN